MDWQEEYDEKKEEHDERIDDLCKRVAKLAFMQIAEADQSAASILLPLAEESARACKKAILKDGDESFQQGVKVATNFYIDKLNEARRNLGEHLSERLIMRYRKKRVTVDEMNECIEHIRVCNECEAKYFYPITPEQYLAEGVKGLYDYLLGDEDEEEDEHPSHYELVAYADNEMEEVDRGLLESHLRLCEACLEVAVELREERAQKGIVGCDRCRPLIVAEECREREYADRERYIWSPYHKEDSCLGYENTIHYMDGVLQKMHREVAERHFTECRSCRRLYRELKSLRDRLRVSTASCSECSKGELPPLRFEPFNRFNQEAFKMKWQDSKDGHPFYELIVSYAKEELTREELEEVKAHVETCWDCTEELQELKTQSLAAGA